MLQCGKALEKLGCVTSEYVTAMWERELMFSSYVGREVAIPHGTEASRRFVKQAQLVMLRFSEPLDWGGEEVTLTFAIASTADEHGEILGNVAEALMNTATYDRLIHSADKNEILQLLGPKLS